MPLKFCCLTLLHSERPKLLAFLSAIGLIELKWLYAKFACKTVVLYIVKYLTEILCEIQQEQEDQRTPTQQGKRRAADMQATSAKKKKEKKQSKITAPKELSQVPINYSLCCHYNTFPDKDTQLPEGKVLQQQSLRI